MRKLSFLALMAAAFFLSYCNSTKKAMAPAKLTYQENIQPIITGKCTPCHIPPKGNKTPYNNFESVKTDIDKILERIQKQPGEKGFMPFKHAKLPDSTIQVFVKWKADGLLEK